MSVNTPEFRVAFPSVFRTKFNKLKKKNEYSIVALFPKGTDLTELKQAAHAALVKKFGPKSDWPGKLRSPFRDQGDRAKIKDGKETIPQGYVKGNIYLNLSSDQKPGVVDEGVQKIIDESEFYGGCWAIASLSCYGYDNGDNKGVNFGLINVQKMKDDDAFGNRTKPEQDFSPVANNEAETSQSSSDIFS